MITLRVSIPESLIEDREQTARTHEQIARRLEQIPGVASVGLSSSITMDGNDSNDPIFVEDFPGPGGRLPPLRRFKWIGERYFETMGNRIVAGRVITWSDVYTRAPVVVVTENFAREYWNDPAAAIGRRIRQNPKNPWRTNPLCIQSCHRSRDMPACWAVGAPSAIRNEKTAMTIHEDC